jgi:toxin ParE1/3/4
MPANVVVTDHAERDMDEIWDYIAEDGFRRADHIVDQLRASMQLIAQFPKMGRLRPEFGLNLRSYATGEYVVFYLPTNGGITVTRVLHGRRDLRVIFDDEHQ